ncbi:hypothetical protein [Paenibacillus sp. sgz5001063]|uniref:hypothetical protein n=1 Tax=Paenibacillus sp. sgz5001063 TaxID=3242474 RepID=UPI0036D2C527
MKKKLGIAIIASIFLTGNAVGVFAATQYKEVKAYFYPSMKVELNGQPADSVKALKYDGALYLSVKSMTDYFGLDSTLKYDNANNKVTIGGPRYINISSLESPNLYQVIVNGNWNYSYLTSSRIVVSNYYMGIDMDLAVQNGISLEDYSKSLLKGEYNNLTVTSEVDAKISNVEAKVINYKDEGNVGRLAILHKGSDFVTIHFFVDRSRFKESDFNVYDKILKSLTIQ